MRSEPWQTTFKSDLTSLSPPGSRPRCLWTDSADLWSQHTKPHLGWFPLFLSSPTFSFVFAAGGGTEKQKLFKLLLHCSCFFNLTRKTAVAWNIYSISAKFRFPLLNNKQALKAAPPQLPEQSPPTRPSCLCAHSLRSFSFHLGSPHTVLWGPIRQHVEGAGIFQNQQPVHRFFLELGLCILNSNNQKTGQKAKNVGPCDSRNNIHTVRQILQLCTIDRTWMGARTYLPASPCLSPQHRGPAVPTSSDVRGIPAYSSPSAVNSNF